MVTTEAGAGLLQRLSPALTEVAAAIDAVNSFRDTPTGTLRLNVPASAARLVLPQIVPPFLATHPDIRLEVITEESFVDVIAAGCDAGIRYEERLEQDMIAVPIGPRIQRFATAAAPAYLNRHGRPDHPRDLLQHACLRGKFASGVMPPWEYERDGNVLLIDPSGPLIIRAGGASDLAIDAAIAGTGIVYLFEDWLRPYLNSGTLEAILEPWWQSFSGPSSTIPDGSWCPRRYARLSTTSKIQQTKLLRRRKRGHRIVLLCVPWLTRLRPTQQPQLVTSNLIMAPRQNLA